MRKREAGDVSSLEKDGVGGPPHVRRLWALSWLHLCEGSGERIRALRSGRPSARRPVRIITNPYSAGAKQTGSSSATAGTGT